MAQMISEATLRSWMEKLGPRLIALSAGIVACSRTVVSRCVSSVVITNASAGIDASVPPASLTPSVPVSASTVVENASVSGASLVPTAMCVIGVPLPANSSATSWAPPRMTEFVARRTATVSPSRVVRRMSMRARIGRLL